MTVEVDLVLQLASPIIAVVVALAVLRTERKADREAAALAREDAKEARREDRESAAQARQDTKESMARLSSSVDALVAKIEPMAATAATHEVRIANCEKDIASVRGDVAKVGLFAQRVEVQVAKWGLPVEKEGA